MKKLYIIFIAIIVIAVLLGAWYLLSPLFIDNVVNEDVMVSENASTLYTGLFVDADSFHKVSGEITISQSSQRDVIRFENFEATNGPDLKVYLATDTSATDFVSLGDLKGNIGSQNYILPAETDLEKYNTVLIWCEQFSVLFGSALLN